MWTRCNNNDNLPYRINPTKKIHTKQAFHSRMNAETRLNGTSFGIFLFPNYVLLFKLYALIYVS